MLFMANVKGALCDAAGVSAFTGPLVDREAETIELKKNKTRQLKAFRRMQLVTCDEGEIWITQKHDPMDYVLEKRGCVFDRLSRKSGGAGPSKRPVNRHQIICAGCLRRSAAAFFINTKPRFSSPPSISNTARPTSAGRAPSFPMLRKNFMAIVWIVGQIQAFRPLA